MSQPTAIAQLEGVSVITKGMHAGISPRLLPVDQLALGINITNRGGLPRTRPIFRKLPLTYENEDTKTNATTKIFQCASFYKSYGNNESCLIAAIGGRIFRYLVGSNNAVQDISISDDLNNQIADKVWMWQSEDFLIINDAQKFPLFFNGATLSRSLGPPFELPPGKMGCYVQGRNWMVLPNGKSFMAGDLVYSDGFGDGFNGRRAVLKTTENEFLSGGGAFAVPANTGEITAMTTISIPDTSLGQGPLCVMTQGCVYNVQTPILREDWFTTEYPTSVIGLPNYGALSQECAVAVNGDIWYRSQDGIRSYRIGRRDMGSGWVHTPMSVEVGPILSFDSENLLNFSSSILFDNRLLMTCSPYKVPDKGTPHRGLIALDFNNISNLTMRSTPCYDGLWTGLPILQLVKGNFGGTERCFAFALDAEENICLYEILKDSVLNKFDYDGTKNVPIESSFETRSFSGKDGGNILKRLYCSDLFLDKLAGLNEVDFSFQYRSDQDPEWHDWHNFELCAPAQDCSTADCPTFQDVQPQYRTFIRLPQPAETCNPITKRPYRTGYEFQIRMQWTGYAQLNRLMVWTEPRQDSVQAGCPTTETCSIQTACNAPWFTYSIETAP